MYNHSFGYIILGYMLLGGLPTFKTRPGFSSVGSPDSLFCTSDTKYGLTRTAKSLCPAKTFFPVCMDYEIA